MLYLYVVNIYVYIWFTIFENRSVNHDYWLNTNLTILHKVIFIYSEHDIRRLVPDWQAYMVFIDYNEDNIILEPESGGHKALHLTTVKALEQKAYGKVTMVSLYHS